MILMTGCGGSGDGTSMSQNSDDSDTGAVLSDADASTGLEDAMASASEATPLVLITEAMLANEFTILDEAGEADDWFEIANFGDDDVDLNGWGFTVGDPLMDAPFLVSERVNLAAGAYLILWADKDEEQGPLHTHFKLSKKDGEILTLLNPDGAVVDQVNIPANDTDDESFARVSMTDEWRVSTQPSPGTSND